DRRISASEALSIARSRARGADFVGARPSSGGAYVFRFERNGGQLFDITVDAETGRAGGG
ncbi:MAG TPA: PepSY domain-containing protein, partial [Brevundimonas sp.]|nr:PepSY domain-containing protein [Brevundimonas sp.]